MHRQLFCAWVFFLLAPSAGVLGQAPVSGAGPADNDPLGLAADKEKPRSERGRSTIFDWPIGRGGEDAEEKEESKRMPNDSPHFTDNSGTVGKGRVMLESGYTFTYDHSPRGNFTSHSFPEALLRIGMFADWFEARFEWNYANERNAVDGTQQSAWGAQDMSVGMRLALTEQRGWLPESALNLAMSVPTGSSAFTAHQCLPEIRYHYTWEITKKLELEANTIGFGARDPSGHVYTVFSQTANLEYALTDKAELFFEWFGFFPSGAATPDILPQYYYHTGVTYYFTDDFALFGHAAVGLNRHADDFFTGFGVLVRR